VADKTRNVIWSVEMVSHIKLIFFQITVPDADGASDSYLENLAKVCPNTKVLMPMSFLKYG